MNDSKIRMLTAKRIHCEKCQNTEFPSGPYFPVFQLNTDIYFVNLRIQSGNGKIRTRKNSVFGHFTRSDNDTKSNPCFTFSSVNNIIDWNKFYIYKNDKYNWFSMDRGWKGRNNLQICLNFHFYVLIWRNISCKNALFCSKLVYCLLSDIVISV